MWPDLQQEKSFAEYCRIKKRRLNKKTPIIDTIRPVKRLRTNTSMLDVISIATWGNGKGQPRIQSCKRGRSRQSKPREHLQREERHIEVGHASNGSVDVNGNRADAEGSEKPGRRSRIAERKRGIKRHRTDTDDDLELEPQVEEVAENGGGPETGGSHIDQPSPNWRQRFAKCPNCGEFKDASRLRIFSSRGLNSLHCSFCKLASAASKWKCECERPLHTCSIHRCDPIVIESSHKHCGSDILHDSFEHGTSYDVPPKVKPMASGTSTSLIINVPISARGVRLYDYTGCPKIRAKFPRLFNK